MDIFVGQVAKIGTIPKYKKLVEYNGVEVWTKEPQKDSNHCSFYASNDRLYVLWGVVYECDYLNPVEFALRKYFESGEQGLFDVDGEFMFFDIKSSTEMAVFQCNYGMQDLYYRFYENKPVFTTEPGLLFKDFSKGDIDEESVADYLLYGKMIGENTFSRRVKSVGRGQEIRINGNDIRLARNRMMISEPVKEDWSLDEITSELTDLYLQSVWKCAHKIVGDSVIFLSGGQDSRLLLSAFNKLFDKKVSCVSYGQYGSEELNCAQVTAEVHDNPFRKIYLKPEDFIQYAEEYVELSAGMDLFPQGNVLYVLKQLEGYSTVFPGSDLTDIFLHASFGREYLSDDLDKFEGDFFEYACSHLPQLRIKGIDSKLLHTILKNGIDLKSNHLRVDSEQYYGHRISEVVSAFLANSEAEHSIAFRTNVIPGKYLNSVDPSSDKKFCKALMQIPMKYRMTDEIHLRMIRKIDPSYLVPLYNNTNLSLQFAPKYWPEASKLEMQREKLYERVMKEYNPYNESKIYYPYYYSDFNGFSRYDPAWVKLMDNMLMNPDSYIYKFWFEISAVAKILEDHRKCVSNYRKELVILTSLELFLRRYLNGGNK